MKIGLVGISLYSQGAEYVLASLARCLSAHGHDVDVILSRIHNDKAKDSKNKPFDVGKNVNVHVLHARRGRESIFELRRLYKRRRYDVVISHADPFSIPMAIAKIGLKHHPKVIAVHHGGIFDTDAFGRKRNLRFSLRKAFVNRMLRLIDAIFVVSEGLREAESRVTGYPLSRIFTLYNPVVDKVFNEKLTNEPSHSWLRKTEVIPVIVAAGAFSGIKNFELLIRAFSKVRQTVQCRLVLFGDGPLRSNYEALVHRLGIVDDVSMPGFTNNLPAELKGATCFVVSSYVESFSIVLVEALACGVPVVSTDCPYGPREILEDGRNGILVVNDDVDAMAEGIHRVLAGKGIRPTREMISRFTSDVVVKRYERAIEDVLRRKKSGDKI